MKHAQRDRSHAHTRPKEHSPRCLFPLLAEIRLIPGASAGLKIALAIVTARAARGGQTRALLRNPSLTAPPPPPTMSERGNFRGGRGGGRGGDRGGRGGGRGGHGGQQDRPKKENILDLGKLMDKGISVKFNGGREGKLLRYPL